MTSFCTVPLHSRGLAREAAFFIYQRPSKAQQIQSLLNAKLYQDVELLISLILPMVNQCGKNDSVASSHYYKILVWYGDSLYEGRQYKKAEDIFQKALLLRKNLNKAKVKSLTSELLLSEVELKYKLYECYMKLGDARNATAMLEGISVRQRTPKVLMSLAHLYQISNIDKQAIACYKEILRKCPLALGAVHGLLQLGCTRDDIVNIISAAGISCPSWLNEWINGHSQMACKEYKKAIETLSKLESHHLHSSIPIMNSIAMGYYRQEDYRNAKHLFEKIIEMDPYSVKGLGIYARILAKEKNVKSLFMLSKRLLQVNENSVDTWLVMAEYNAIKDNVQRAIYFAQKAHVIDSSNIQALVLKGLVNCYLADNKISLASSTAAKAYTKVGRTPSTLLAKSSFQLALNLDPSCELAACSLANIYADKFSDCDKAIKLLQQFLETTPSSKVHLQLGNYYCETHKKQQALDEYRIALSMDSNCSEAQEAIDKLENESRDIEESSLHYELNPIHPLHFDIDDEDGDANTTGSLDEME
ncbi:uncharacterized protein TRIADDRAFT_51605 [Trichoplax adhaerens]|uniref:Anaphase-promoting complex subunit 7 n=1 Tax=Trichoplax adhaerens TaxID=10228 RepID=B3RK31_TRIAD|nr:hypothetical protein TRIADDRAFT_51605 [Trichoplax adhaerens]EDV28561.1 hypothetical protein TRIADDRAFT_51605 [Trichoplax adhaerens]|eukprot:XP_002107763.1 hypothetical protein TRIADDRAFT_51605 [Trichoplax adhaerens]